MATAMTAVEFTAATTGNGFEQKHQYNSNANNKNNLHNFNNNNNTLHSSIVSTVAAAATSATTLLKTHTPSASLLSASSSSSCSSSSFNSSSTCYPTGFNKNATNNWVFEISASTPKANMTTTHFVAGLEQQNQQYEQQQLRSTNAVTAAVGGVSVDGTHDKVATNSNRFPHAVAENITANVGNDVVGFIPTASSTTAVTNANTSALEQYRLQLYNYALNIERFRCPQYSMAAAMAVAAAYATSTGGTTNVNTGEIVNNGSSVSVYPTHPTAEATYMTAGAGGANRFALSMSLFPQRIFQSEEPKPQHSYIGLIAMAILSSTETKLVLSDIYQYILDNYPYFRTRGPGWRNSIRHNLSLNDCFIKSGRSANGKGHYWAIHPANMEDFRKGDFRRRKAQRKVRKHMGLSVDDAGTDSPSPPLLNLTATPPPLPTTHSVLPSNLSLALQHHHQHMQSARHHLTAAAAPARGYGYLPQHNHDCPPHALITIQQQRHQQLRDSGIAFNSGIESTDSAASLALQTLTPFNVRQTYAANIRQQHHQQQLEQQKEQQQQFDFYFNHSHNDINTLVQTPPQTQQLEIINETTTTTRTTASVIANLYSQTRKRQFDVASLLAPDIKDAALTDGSAANESDMVVDDDDKNDEAPIKYATALTTPTFTIPTASAAAAAGITTTQHTVITKVSVQHHHYQQQQQQKEQHQQQCQQQRSFIDLDEQEDIDVVENDDDSENEKQRHSLHTLHHIRRGFDKNSYTSNSYSRLCSPSRARHSTLTDAAFTLETNIDVDADEYEAAADVEAEAVVEATDNNKWSKTNDHLWETKHVTVPVTQSNKSKNHLRNFTLSPLKCSNIVYNKTATEAATLTSCAKNATSASNISAAYVNEEVQQDAALLQVIETTAPTSTHVNSNCLAYKNNNSTSISNGNSSPISLTINLDDTTIIELQNAHTEHQGETHIIQQQYAMPSTTTYPIHYQQQQNFLQASSSNDFYPSALSPPPTTHHPNIFRRYYGTYMAAAAARRINNINIPALLYKQEERQQQSPQ